uniref:flavodoxin family protein n=1 Tax=uncultured Acidovorax sp. TaxID=158751 RepID=UPI0025F4AEE2|nr:hypothetical protein [uncultured Acidovorax sp.]
MSIKVILLATLAAAVVLGLASVLVMLRKDQTFVSSLPFQASSDLDPNSAVVYYSRSGHTEAAAREIARAANASISRIEASYPLTFSGQRNAIADAEAHVLPPIAVEGPGTSKAERVILVTPTWMYSPATPMWSYIEHADLDGKSVALVMTGNSKYDLAEVQRFGERIRSRGGHLTQHVFIRRGRIWWQMSRQSLLEESRRVTAVLHWGANANSDPPTADAGAPAR